MSYLRHSLGWRNLTPCARIQSAPADRAEIKEKKILTFLYNSVNFDNNKKKIITHAFKAIEISLKFLAKDFFKLVPFFSHVSYIYTTHNISPPTSSFSNDFPFANNSIRCPSSLSCFTKIRIIRFNRLLSR